MNKDLDPMELLQKLAQNQVREKAMRRAIEQLVTAENGTWQSGGKDVSDLITPILGAPPSEPPAEVEVEPAGEGEPAS